ncbi:hypothetical protein SUGI_0539170 [Cryptomeria japonica]|nr:hypothetical protein SUGI_0539170 [Cryptomeria japonica]
MGSMGEQSRKETPEAHVFTADLPRLRKEDLKINLVEKNTLRISGKRYKEQEEKTDQWHLVERSSGRFMRQFRLPENVNVDGISAKLENGVLTVNAPKTHPDAANNIINARMMMNGVLTVNAPKALKCKNQNTPSCF